MIRWARRPGTAQVFPKENIRMICNFSLCHCMHRTSLIFIVMVYSLHNYVYTLSIQDTKAWYCGPAEPCVSLFCDILWKKIRGFGGRLIILQHNCILKQHYMCCSIYLFLVSCSSLLYCLCLSTDFITVCYFRILILYWFLPFLTEFQVEVIRDYLPFLCQ